MIAINPNENTKVRTIKGSTLKGFPPQEKLVHTTICNGFKKLSHHVRFLFPYQILINIFETYFPFYFLSSNVSYLVLKLWGFLLQQRTRSPGGLRRSYLHRLNIPTPRRYC